MSIDINSLYDANGTLRANQGGISWALWGTKDVSVAPQESGAGLITDGAGAVTVPSAGASGLLMLYISDTDMALYDV